MGRLMLVSAVWMSALFVAPAVRAGSATVTARITNRCATRLGTIRVPRGKTATSFRVLTLRKGVKCHGGGRADSKGWGVTKNGRKVYYWSRWRNKRPSEVGGPLSRLHLGAGTYRVFVDGGRGAVARVGFSIR